MYTSLQLFYANITLERGFLFKKLTAMILQSYL